MRLVLSGIYIKGFKTFARPVRMPLEGGVTAIVGPNGSGKSNITDAVLFALGEQSPGVLRAGAMSELIFSGSETLPAAGAAEVTLVLDNRSGEISLPYEGVSLTRRISRAGETEYRINGTRVRLQDFRAVAGEAGIGRHSILRQGSVDAIVAGGAAACRLALEEAAGLGVYRRRRVSASRRLERADVQLERSSQLEAELEGQLRRIEREAAAARAYREIEARYRELSLAHLYRVATRGLDGLRGKLDEARTQAAELAARERDVREEEARIEVRLQRLEDGLGETEQRLEGLEDGAEDLRVEALRSDRTLLRLEAGRGREGERRLAVTRLEDELRRVSQTLESLDESARDLEAETSEKREELGRLQRIVASSREKSASTESERDRLARKLEGLRARIAGLGAHSGQRVMSEEAISNLAAVVSDLEASEDRATMENPRALRDRVDGMLARVDEFAEEINRRRGAFAAAVGRAESRVRALGEAAPDGASTRLYEVIRARPGYEVAVEAALGEYGAGVLAENLDEGMKLLSDVEPVAVRLDARAMESNGALPGKPLIECVEVLDARYDEAVRRLLTGIFVVDRPDDGANANGYVAVTRDGFRLTRTGVSLRPGPGNFARETRLSAWMEHLEALKGVPGGTLYDLKETVSGVSNRLERLAGTVDRVKVLAVRTARTRALLSREARRRKTAGENLRKAFLERERTLSILSDVTSRTERALAEAKKNAERVRVELAASTAAAEAATSAAAASDRRLSELRDTLSSGAARRKAISRRLERSANALQAGAGNPEVLAARAARAATKLVTTVRRRRNALRRLRGETAEAHRRVSAERTTISRKTVELAGKLATTRAQAERLAEEVCRTETAAAEAGEEIQAEWGTTLDAARHEAEKHGESTDGERITLARRLK